ncbi:cold-regulated 413 inner membrane protein 1, chloroplastic isoform X1 [Brachypodium distachyon]|nr:cold-regulated 413 inner membrane protein 1, chloroplastic isoform X1 [Brachypodium distachyon]|eukprot:XP_003567882.1 cold-regulated 413 inner membrane protein 1, chloroplastic isoform X1 [Brachypodium distachyon]
MSMSLRLALPSSAPVLPPRVPLPAGNAARRPSPSPVLATAAAALRTGALRGCASLPLKPQPPGMMITGAGAGRRGSAAVCRASSAYLSPTTMHWVSAAATAVLLLAKGTGIHKSFLVPLFALQAPSSVVSWIKSDYGLWTAFLALLVRLFFSIPGELELPLSAMLLLNVAPYQMMNLRGTQGGAIVSLALAAYLAFQHFTRAGGLGRAFDQGSIIATLAIICVTVINVILLF